MFYKSVHDLLDLITKSNMTKIYIMGKSPWIEFYEAVFKADASNILEELKPEMCLTLSAILLNFIPWYSSLVTSRGEYRI